MHWRGALARTLDEARQGAGLTVAGGKAMWGRTESAHAPFDEKSIRQHWSNPILPLPPQGEVGRQRRRCRAHARRASGAQQATISPIEYPCGIRPHAMRYGCKSVNYSDVLLRSPNTEHHSGAPARPVQASRLQMDRMAYGTRARTQRPPRNSEWVSQRGLQADGMAQGTLKSSTSAGMVLHLATRQLRCHAPPPRG